MRLLDLNIPEAETLELVENYVKVYPDKLKLVEFKMPYLAQKEGLVPSKSEKKGKKMNSNVELERSLKRTKTTISDIILSNNFDLFVTFTFNSNRHDINACKKRLSKWLKNQREIRDNFHYLIVPEFHKDGKSLHFHALFKGYNGILLPACKNKAPTATYCNQKHKHSIVTQRGKTIYNLKSYQLGFTNATYIKDRTKLSSYVKKYITKDMPIFNNKKRYWTSQKLTRPYTLRNYPIRQNPFIELKEVYNHKYFTISESSATISALTNKGV